MRAAALIVTMDDDLQHPPEEIPKLLDTITAGDLDLVYGCYDKKKHPLLEECRVGGRQHVLPPRVSIAGYRDGVSHFSPRAAWRRS